MRSKDKYNLSGQLSIEAGEKLKRISADNGLSQIKMIERLIEVYGSPLRPEVVPVKAIVKTQTKPTVKEVPKKFNLAEELAKLKAEGTKKPTG